MKIKLSKKQWETIGKTAGWMKKAEEATNGTNDTNVQYFASKGEALGYLKDHGSECVGWKENGKLKHAIYWNGKVAITNAGEKKRWATTATIKKTANGWGHLSGDLSDVLEAQVMMGVREGQNQDQIFLRIKSSDQGLQNMMAEENLTDDELREFIADNYAMYSRIR